MGKKPYKIIDFSLRKRLERELESREEKETKKRFKICLICGERKSLFSFGVDRRSSDGRVGACKICKSKEALKYYYLNRERILSESKEARKMGTMDRSKYSENYREKNKKHLQMIASRWYRKNKKTIKKRNLKYYEEHKEACQATRKLWIEGHKEEIKKYNREYQKLRK